MRFFLSFCGDVIFIVNVMVWLCWWNVLIVLVMCVFLMSGVWLIKLIDSVLISLWLMLCMCVMNLDVVVMSVCVVVVKCLFFDVR